MMKSLRTLACGLVAALATSLAMAGVEVNQATQADLQTVKGIGPAMSGRMLDERQKNVFKDWADLIARVSGIGPGNAAKFSGGGLTVNGAAFDTAGATPVAPLAASGRPTLGLVPAPVTAAPAKVPPVAAHTTARSR